VSDIEVGDEISINDVSFIAVKQKVDLKVTPYNWEIAESINDTVKNLAATINYIEKDGKETLAGVKATVTSSTITITAAKAGPEGNEIALTSSNESIEVLDFLTGGSKSGADSAKKCKKNQLRVNGMCQDRSLFCEKYDNGRHHFIPKYTGGETTGVSLPQMALAKSDVKSNICVVDEIVSCDPHEVASFIDSEVAYIDENGQEKTSELRLNVCTSSETNCKKIAKGELRLPGGESVEIDSGSVKWASLDSKDDAPTCVLTQQYCDALNQGIYHGGYNRCVVSINACHIEGKLKSGARCLSKAKFKASKDSCEKNNMKFDGFRCYPEEESFCQNFGMVWIDSDEDRQDLLVSRVRDKMYPERDFYKGKITDTEADIKASLKKALF